MKYAESDTLLSDQEFEQLMQELPGILDQLEQEMTKKDWQTPVFQP
ncbi:hypothetical protein SPFL3102_02034 [Sporomusaceae bacterium FL31]|nr:hypothetical protein SPFL3101_03668 [Sporomusaceae bacterium FL31]GCE34223.1 hypothetical protein SPFL3102_02034 [Sporomusaceae bacterium]